MGGKNARDVSLRILRVAVIAAVAFGVVYALIQSSAPSPSVSSPPVTTQAIGTVEDPYGYRCSPRDAEPYGLCPSDHNERQAGGVTATDRFGTTCAYELWDPNTNTCPYVPTTSTSTTPPVDSDPNCTSGYSPTGGQCHGPVQP